MTITIKKNGQRAIRIVKREQTTPTYFINAIAFTWAGVKHRYSVSITRKPAKKVDFPFIAL